MLEARFIRGSTFKKIIESIKDLVNDANFDCSSNGIELQAMDKTHTCLVCLKINQDGLDFYRCDRNISMGLNLPTLSKMLKCGDSDDSITIKAHDVGDTVTITLEKLGTRVKTSDFTLKLIDIDSENLNIPETGYTAVVKLRSLEFSKISKDLNQIGLSVTISITENAVKFSSSGDVGSANITLLQRCATDNGADDVNISFSEPIAIAFALKWFNHFIKATPLSSHVTLSMKKDLPLGVEYEIQDIGHLRFYLAPRLTDEELFSQ